MGEGLSWELGKFSIPVAPKCLLKTVHFESNNPGLQKLLGHTLSLTFTFRAGVFLSGIVCVPKSVSQSSPVFDSM